MNENKTIAETKISLLRRQEGGGDCDVNRLRSSDEIRANYATTTADDAL